MVDQLDARKRRVLVAVIDDYVASAEPVGSRTLARKYDLGVSPATIRNEMADLELLGYLEQLHTSSGRIPSSKGYRFYVNGLLPPAPVSLLGRRRINDWYRRRVRRIEEVFQETAHLIAQTTKNVALVLAPQLLEARFRSLQFLPLDPGHVITVLMTDAGFIENKVLKVPAGATFADFQRLAAVINRHLAGLTLAEISRQTLAEIRDEIGDAALYEAALSVIQRALEASREDRLYVGGMTGLLGQPEFRDVAKVKELLLILEEQERIKRLLRLHRSGGLSVTIGQENTDADFKESSLVTATYHLNGELLGTIAVLGPTRMEYAKAMSLLGYLNDNLTKIIQRFAW